MSERKRKRFGCLITSARNMRRLSQRELATLSGVDHGYLSRIESGDKLPGPEVFKKLMTGLKLTGPSRSFARSVLVNELKTNLEKEFVR